MSPRQGARAGVERSVRSAWNRGRSGAESPRIIKKPGVRRLPRVHKDAWMPSKSPELHGATFEFHFGNANKFTKCPVLGRSEGLLLACNPMQILLIVTPDENSID